MDSNLLKNVAVQLAGIGAGSPDDVRNLIAIITEDDTDVSEDNASQLWCAYGVWIEMPKIEEGKNVADDHLVLWATSNFWKSISARTFLKLQLELEQIIGLRKLVIEAAFTKKQHTINFVEIWKTRKGK